MYITNKTERFNFDSGCVVWVASNEMRPQLQPKEN